MASVHHISTIVSQATVPNFSEAMTNYVQEATKAAANRSQLTRLDRWPIADTNPNNIAIEHNSQTQAPPADTTWKEMGMHGRAAVAQLPSGEASGEWSRLEPPYCWRHHGSPSKPPPRMEVEEEEGKGGWRRNKEQVAPPKLPCWLRHCNCLPAFVRPTDSSMAHRRATELTM
jgi:hypothetical protein